MSPSCLNWKIRNRVSIPLAVPELAERADAILEVWCPGTSGGGAIADVLTGKVNPCGRLTTEFPCATGQLQLFYNRLQTGRPTDRIRGCSSCFRDGPYRALYPFGFGLSYTTFAYSNETAKVESDRVVLEVDVTNVGSRVGEETVQAYTRQMVGLESLPIRELRAWKKVVLSPGQTVHVSMEIPLDQLSHWSQGRRVPASGRLRTWICHDSVSGHPQELLLK